MQPATGKRAQARRLTRRTIRSAAMDLFLTHGFDAVTTTQVAEAAGVSPATLFNHFVTKEDLFFGQVRELERALVAVVRSCPAGGSVLEALRSHVLYELTAGRVTSNPAAVAPFHRQVAASPRLQAHENEMYARRELVLAAAIAEVLDAEPLHARVAARLYVAAEQLVATELRERLNHADSATVLREIEPFIRDVFAYVAAGVGNLPSTGG